ncbi:phosphoadenosine phosphosulfate reductase [Microbulbifer flavimaris]|uniref:Phosphoadenosine phosphosulfate reductase n=1 Tax=Microbulbifer flavimaris TaxID=1781068 RepID=A0ABX4I0Q2_9GAMM|nr:MULTISPECIES: phosphoadenosine phosphosulfate reductase family protein [Microbulbifer]KUJ82965.1 phosphoadenosine phosphosulfate reductase [Microbulbifer sp. ZGT114]PCO05149.1 phosphoadenosine phosphosulfate reductase [Microbulbifer flavimaris]
MAKKMTIKSALFDDSPRHVLGLSGGKDSAALAVYLKQRYPEIHENVEYFFTDTGAELKEVYDFLDRLESYLDKEIIRLGSGRSFDHWLKVHNGYLPSAKQRWCTRVMKIQPFEDFVGDDPVISYIGIRADENREGYISQKENIKAIFPFIDDGLVREDIFQILEDTVGIPEYYKWRSRSGCYFCFFQRQDEWLGLKRNHPELFEKAKDYEQRLRKKFDWQDGEVEVGGYGYTWSSQGTVDELVARAEKREKERGIIASNRVVSERWQDLLRDAEDDDPEDQACLICSL